MREIWPLEKDITEGALESAANPRRPAQKGRSGVTLDREPPVVVVASEAATGFKIARDLDAIADALETEGAP
jgi:hypothetical protein